MDHTGTCLSGLDGTDAPQLVGKDESQELISLTDAFILEKQLTGNYNSVRIIY